MLCFSVVLSAVASLSAGISTVSLARSHSVPAVTEWCESIRRRKIIFYLSGHLILLSEGLYMLWSLHDIAQACIDLYHIWVYKCIYNKVYLPPTAPRAQQHKWLPTAPGVCSRCVCVHFGWVNCRAQIPSMGTILATCHVTSLHKSVIFNNW